MTKQKLREHTAKEGGEAGAVDDFGESGWSAGWNAGYRDGYNEAFAKYGCASLPQPSPLLAKGGDVVSATEGPYEVRVCKDLPTSCCDYGVVSLSAGREVCRVWEKQDAIAIAAALSTPTEGPASQTEGMGGDAATVEKLRKLAEAAAKVAPGPWEADGEETEGGWGKHDEFVILDAQGRRLCGTENADHTFGSISEENDGDGGHYQWNEPARVLMHFIAACDPVAILSLLAARSAYSQGGE